MSTSKQTCSLLLLPPPPDPSTYESLRDVYSTPLLNVLQKTSVSSVRTALEIALPCPHLYGQEALPRRSLYAPTQHLVASLYRLICVICARHSINIEDADGIDVRILLLAYPRDGRLPSARTGSAEANLEGPVVSLETLARSGRTWDKVYALTTAAGEQLLQNWQSSQSLDYRAVKVDGSPVADGDECPAQNAPAEGDTLHKHSSVAVGGTFDHLHIGHKLLLSMTAFMLDHASEGPRSITVGITGDELLKNKQHAEYLESWSARQQFVDSFMRSILDLSPPTERQHQVEEKIEPGANGHAIHVTLPSQTTIKYVEIWDPFGPTITDKTISALIISAETRSGGAAVNTKRAEKGWPALDVLEVDVLDADENMDGSGQGEAVESFESKLSSTKIRRKMSEKTAAATSDT